MINGNTNESETRQQVKVWYVSPDSDVIKVKIISARNRYLDRDAIEKLIDIGPLNGDNIGLCLKNYQFFKPHGATHVYKMYYDDNAYIRINMRFKYNKAMMQLIPNLPESMYILSVSPVVIAKCEPKGCNDTSPVDMDITPKEFKKMAMASYGNTDKELNKKQINANKQFDFNTFAAVRSGTSLVFIKPGDVGLPDHTNDDGPTKIVKHETITCVEMSLKSLDEIKQKNNLIAMKIPFGELLGFDQLIMYVIKHQCCKLTLEKAWFCDEYCQMKNTFERNGAGIWLSVPLNSVLSEYDIFGTVFILNKNFKQAPLTPDRVFGIINFIFHTSCEADKQFEKHGNRYLRMKFINDECEKYIKMQSVNFLAIQNKLIFTTIDWIVPSLKK